MKKRLLMILSLLCTAALVLGVFPAAATEVAGESRVIIAEWKDEDNYDALRPASLEATMSDGSKVTLNEENGWSGSVTGLVAGDYTWEVPEVAGYTVSIAQGDVTIVTLTHPVQKTSVTATAEWEDNGNAAGLRPTSVKARLLANGEPKGSPVTLNSGNGWQAGWSDLPVTVKGTNTPIVYTVEATEVPANYTLAESGMDIRYTLMSGTLQIRATVSGSPEGIPPEILQMRLTGPDYRLPRTIKLSEFDDGVYTLENALPGAYLVTETNYESLMTDGYILDVAASQVQDAVQLKDGGTAAMTLRNVYTDVIPEPEVNEDPTSTYGDLSFEILGPDARMPMTITYDEFTNGRYELTELTPGSYVIVERNAGTLVDSYTLETDSTTGVALNVTADGNATATLFNHYVPAPTPVPNDETVNIPVVKAWNDNNDRDGNRPQAVTVRLYADGAEIDNRVLTAADGWQYTFTDLPRFRDGDPDLEIAYSVNEDPVPMYNPVITGFTITNNYVPELTSVSVRKVWDDNNNEANLRPVSISVTLSNGQNVVLNEQNGWFATITDLPAYINGQPATYTWSEHEIIGYVQTGTAVEGTTTVFTNSLWNRPQVDDENEVPKTRGDVWYIFEEYETPLGVEVTINHVGDCFD